jgi:hypothetical protein
MSVETTTADLTLRDDAQTRAKDIRTRLDSLTANINEIPALVRQRHFVIFGVTGVNGAATA